MQLKWIIIPPINEAKYSSMRIDPVLKRNGSKIKSGWIEKKKNNGCSFFRLVLDPHSHAPAVDYSIRQAKLQREVMAVTLELTMGERGDKCEREKEQQSEKEEGTGGSLFSRGNFLLYGRFQYSHGVQSWKTIIRENYTCVRGHAYMMVCSGWSVTGTKSFRTAKITTSFSRQRIFNLYL